jgi:hypothetical protein
MLFLAQRWHFDKALESADWNQNDGYATITLNNTMKEFNRVMQIIPVSSGPTFLANYEVTKVDLIWNKELEKAFEEKVKTLQGRGEKGIYAILIISLSLLEYQSTWSQEEKPQERAKVSQRLVSYIDHFPPQPENVKIVPVWFGTSLNNALRICSIGFGGCYTNGNLGRGVYFTNSGGTNILFFL